MNPLILVGLGGLAGAVSRYIVSGLVQGGSPGFPVGTLFVNLSGSFALGLIITLSDYGVGVDASTRLMVAVGFIGAYTTMSTFSYESVRLLIDGKIPHFALNVLSTNVLCLSGVLIGRWAAMALTGG